MEDRQDAQLRAQAERIVNGARTRGSVAAWLIALLIATAAAIGGLSAPAIAHGKKQHQPQTQQAQPQAMPGGTMSNAAQGGAPAAQGQADGTMSGMAMDRSQMPFLERLIAWFGRLHPLVVHFPIAFFPAALFTAIVGRRRPSFAAPVQFLVVAGGIFAPIAAAAGWITGFTADPEPILAYHRWLGVAIGVVGAGLGIWAWRRPWEDRGSGMIFALTLMTVGIAVQGFLGAALTHGMDHLMF